jgi:hypothetical protein
LRQLGRPERRIEIIKVLHTVTVEWDTLVGQSWKLTSFYDRKTLARNERISLRVVTTHKVCGLTYWTCVYCSDVCRHVCRHDWTSVSTY